MSETEFILSPFFRLSQLDRVFITAKMGYTDQYIRLQGKKIVLWPKDRFGSDVSAFSKKEVQSFILREIRLESIESQYLDFLFVYGIEYRLLELTDSIYQVHDIDRIYKIVTTLAKTDYFLESMSIYLYRLFQNNQRRFIDYVNDDEDRLLEVTNLCLATRYYEYKMFHEMFEQGTIVVPETVFSYERSYLSEDTFKNVLSCYLSQTLGIPILDLNKQNCYKETNRIADLYQSEIKYRWFRCGLQLISYGLDVDTWYSMVTELISVSEKEYPSVLMWIKESPPHHHSVCAKKFFEYIWLHRPAFFRNYRFQHIRAMFIHLTLEEHVDEIIDLAYDAMFHLGSDNIALFSYNHMWRVYHIAEFYFRQHRQNCCEQELIRQRCIYVEPSLTDDPNTINVTINLSERNSFTDIFDKSPESFELLLRLNGLCIKLMIHDTAIVLDSNETLDRSAMTAINRALQGDMLPSVKNLLLIVAIYYSEVELIRTVLMHGADPTVSRHYAIRKALKTSSEIGELVLTHSLETCGISPEISEKLLLEEVIDVKIDMLLRYGVDWKLILKKYILDVFDGGVLNPVLHAYYISSGVTLSSFLLKQCINSHGYRQQSFTYRQVLSHIIKWDLQFFPDTTINDLITQEHLDTIFGLKLFDYYTMLLSEGLDPRHSDDRLWRKVCVDSIWTWLKVCLNSDEHTDAKYVPRSETLGENDNWAIKTYFRIGQREFYPYHLEALKFFLERNVDTLDIDTMTEISYMVEYGTSSKEICCTILLQNLKYIEGIYAIMDRYRETHPEFSFERHTSILIE